MVSQIIFGIILLATALLFYRNSSHIFKNIQLGRNLPKFENRKSRIKILLKVAFGQSKISKKPIAGFLHIIVYAGFLIVNIELIEILFDGIAGTHRVLSFLPFYNTLISILEFFAVSVILVCIAFLIRRNILKVRRLNMSELTSWPRIDANIILITEIVLMLAFLMLNTSDGILLAAGTLDTNINYNFVISKILSPILSGVDNNTLVNIERSAWWTHIVGVFIFLNYIPFSKHFHILLAFPNVYYSKLKPLAYISNMEAITREVRIAMGQESPDTGIQSNPPITFGAKDVRDLTWKSLMDAYSCTECGRCTAVCPANLTGKKLSPRKIVMDTRDRLEELGYNIRKHGEEFTDNKMLLHNYITAEEVWACTTCNACTYECPVNIDPVSIIMELRRYIFLEKAAAPSSLNAMSVNIENNGAPWQYSAADRNNWTKDLVFNK